MLLILEDYVRVLYTTAAEVDAPHVGYDPGFIEDAPVAVQRGRGRGRGANRGRGRANRGGIVPRVPGAARRARRGRGG